MEISNPNKLIFPAVGLTKADLVRHYERVGPTMLEFLGARPLTLQRFPNGVDAKGFMQKNAAKHFPPSIARFGVPKRDGGVTEYAVVTHADDLAYLANQGTITFHMWTATAAQPDRPDWMILDLDPEANDLDGVRFATIAARELLAEFALEGFALATGSKGFHIWVRLDGNTSFGDVSLATRALAGIAATRHPERLTTEFLKKDRAGRVFVDWLRNTGTATVVVPFSLRPRPNAPVAVPVTWDELDHITPDQWTLTDLGDRLSINTSLPAQPLPVADIFAAARAAGVDLESPHDRFGRRR
jgi:bifunctional non-homologous end joining protein LigD